MQAEYWLQRWRDQQTGFHKDQPMPLLQCHWSTLSLATDSRVLVPLAGKSLDMLWLAAQGHRVLGVELSPLAIQQFLAEHALHAETRISPQGTHHIADRIELICGDVFTLDDATLDTCDAIYDRAAMVALPPAMRQHYARQVYGRLPARCRGLMITLEYPQQEMDGPPFSVDDQEVHRLLDGNWSIDSLELRDIFAEEPRFAQRGVTAFHTAAYRLQHRGDPVD